MMVTLLVVIVIELAAIFWKLDELDTNADTQLLSPEEHERAVGILD